MIPVKFRLEPKTDVYTHLVDCADTMPWLNYLYQNCKDMRLRKIHNANAFLNTVIYEFDLDPKKETYYRMKYGNGL